MYIGKTQKVKENQILASAKFISHTYQVDETLAKEEGCKKIVKGGTVYPKNDATAIGIVLYDVDVTEGPQAAPVLLDAIVLEDKLPEKVSEEAKAAMKKILFKKFI